MSFEDLLTRGSGEHDGEWMLPERRVAAERDRARTHLCESGLGLWCVVAVTVVAASRDQSAGQSVGSSASAQLQQQHTHRMGSRL